MSKIPRVFIAVGLEPFPWFVLVTREGHFKGRCVLIISLCQKILFPWSSKTHTCGNTDFSSSSPPWNWSPPMLPVWLESVLVFRSLYTKEWTQTKDFPSKLFRQTVHRIPVTQLERNPSQVLGFAVKPCPKSMWHEEGKEVVTSLIFIILSTWRKGLAAD